MKVFIATLAIALTLASGQQHRRGGRQQAAPSTGYGVPAAQPQPQYGQPQASASSLSQSQEHDHQGLDWLLESVPGTPGTDYPIYAQDQLNDFFFDCNGQVEGGYYADPAADCQAFHVCIPDGLGSLSTQSFLCPNGTIFNQEYFICDWWFNFDCSQAEGLYTRNDEVEAEREAASQAQASNINNQYAPAEPAQSQYGKK